MDPDPKEIFTDPQQKSLFDDTVIRKVNFLRFLIRISKEVKQLQNLLIF
jgi:hypothetical protein